MRNTRIDLFETNQSSIPHQLTEKSLAKTHPGSGIPQATQGSVKDKHISGQYGSNSPGAEFVKMGGWRAKKGHDGSAQCFTGRHDISGNAFHVTGRRFRLQMTGDAEIWLSNKLLHEQPSYRSVKWLDAHMTSIEWLLGTHFFSCVFSQFVTWRIFPHHLELITSLILGLQVFARFNYKTYVTS